MKFNNFATYLQTIESLDSRLAMTEALAQLFAKAEASEIDQICYLSLGMLKPKFMGLELNLAEKMMLRVLAQVTNQSVEVVTNEFKTQGDIGLTMQALLEKRTAIQSDLTVSQVYDQLCQIAQEEGEGSQERKIVGMTKLLTGMDKVSAKFLVRIPVKKLRLGFSDMTILDALSWMQTGDKSLRSPLERAYNIRADIGQIAQIFKKSGLVGVEQMTPQTGTPIVPCRATPLLNPQEILDKMGGEAAMEPKFDGFRVQIHIDKSKQFKSETGVELGLFETKTEKSYVEIFSRNMENMTYMFPDLVEASQNLPVDSAILDGEALAFNPQTGQTLDFQETVKRKRKHNIGKVKEEIPLKAFIFDLLYLNGKSLLSNVEQKRRQQLEQVFSKNTSNQLVLTEQKIVDNPEDFKAFFNQVAQEGLEGLMAKKIQAPYKAGARDFTWVKYKIGMQSEMADTVDAIVMGYFKGQGKWTKFGMGKILVGVPSNGQIISLSKVGSGFSEDKIVELVKRSKAVEITHKPTDYVVDKTLIPDVWLKPQILVEIRADSISRSPLYKTQLSLRFPRFIKFRDDKSVDEATSLKQLQAMVKASE
ncbi:ATP-dependent DNA ligase [Candidatus Beckwithbacteria bacterium]|nr:ATP-dependent DNA ligase [Candidatus Beckwithbacteria bacterium]